MDKKLIEKKKIQYFYGDLFGDQYIPKNKNIP